MDDDLERALSDIGYRETVLVEGGPLAEFLRRVGAYDFDPAMAYHDEHGHGFPALRTELIPADRTMPFSEYAHLLGRKSAEARWLVVQHPSTPLEVKKNPERHAQPPVRMMHAAVRAVPPRPRAAPPPPRGPFDGDDLRKALDDWTELETHAESEGPIGTLLRRVGAFDFDLRDEEGSSVLRDAIPLDPTLPFSDYERLLEYGERGRELVAAHPSTPDRVIVELARDESYRVQVATAAHAIAIPILAESAHPAARDEAAKHPATDVSALRKLALDSSDQVRWHVAARAVLPAEIFELFRANKSCASVLAARTDSSEAQLASLVDMVHAHEALARNPRSTPEILRAIASPNATIQVQMKLAEHPNAPEDVIAMLRALHHPSVDKILARMKR